MKKPEKLKPAEFEKKWQEQWEKDRIYQPDLKKAKKPYYNLMMFPYPSAEGLHVGNMYAFTGADINGRYRRMLGYDVFEPIGLDGFGIHSENYAIKIGKHPAGQAKISEANFYRQLRSIGNSFAWENHLETYDPEYYRWTQWIFVQMFQHGLAYRKKSPVNFCPSCKTVLSDEQVIKKIKNQKSKIKNTLDEVEIAYDGCERCGTQVDKRNLEQWFFRITKYAERLLQNTFREDFNWTEKIKIGQRNWIGKKEGIDITYPVIPGSDLERTKGLTPIGITCFTTRPDTNFGATFVVIGPEHPFVNVILNLFQDPKEMPNQVRHDKYTEIKKYVEKARKTSEEDRIAAGRKKTGVFTGFYAVNQLNNCKMPIYISDFVLGHVGTGAVVGVPGHDLRDFEFAQEFKIPVIRVVVGRDGDRSEITRPEQVQEEEGTMMNSGFLDGMDIHKAIGAMMDHLEKKGWGKRVTTYKLRDWCISRQRYWGAPIPMIDCPACGWVAVPEKDLPVLLPNLTDWKPEGTGKGPLAKLPDFVQVKCPDCGGDAERETDVCDTFLDSSWYFLRYPGLSDSGDLSDLPWNSEVTRRWLPVTQYIGGAEHTVLHLLYARFVTMTFKDWSYIDFEEPFSRFYAHGLLIKDGAKMSKSRGNVVIPDEYIGKYGADTLRTYLMFVGPYDAGGDFRDTGIAGMYRFLSRVWRLVQENQKLSIRQDGYRTVTRQAQDKNQKSGELERTIHKTVKEVTRDMENFRYNTAIAHIMEYVNEISKIKNQKSKIPKEVIKTLLLLLAPFVPHMTEELWDKLQHRDRTRKFKSIHLHPWPSYDEKYLVESEITIVVQINGKTRDVIKVKSQKSKVKSEVEKIAKEPEKVKKYLSGCTIRKTVFVPGKLINFVV